MKIKYYPPGELGSTSKISKSKYLRFLRLVYHTELVDTIVMTAAKELWRFNSTEAIWDFVESIRRDMKKLSFEVYWLTEQYPEYAI